MGELIRTNAAERRDEIAVVDDDGELTWGELYERAQQVAAGLAAAGVGNQDRVAFYDKNGIDHFEVFLGAALLNAVCVDVNWRLAGPEVAYIVHDAAAKVLIVGGEFVETYRSFAGDVPDVELTLVIGDAGAVDGLEGAGIEEYDAWRERQTPDDPQTPSAWEDVAFQLYSSGTTGHPKGVMLSNRNFFGLLDAGAELWGFHPDMVSLAVMPLFHIGGGGWAMAAMAMGAKTVTMRDLDPARIIQMFGEHRITHAFLVPAVLQFMQQVPGFDSADYSSLEMMVYGASPISEDVLARAVSVMRCKFSQAYGSTETTGAICHLAPEDHALDGPDTHLLRSCGKPGPGTTIRVVNPQTGEDLPANEVGEIWIASPQVMLGYWNLPEETEAAMVGEFFRSGDMGYFDEDGYLYMHDRLKDMIVSGAENVYPAEIENVLMAHPDVVDVAVIGVPDDRWGETPKALVVARPGSEPDPQEIIEFTWSRLAKFKCPTSVELVDVLPRNPSGKILKKDLRAPYWEGRERMIY